MNPWQTRPFEQSDFVRVVRDAEKRLRTLLETWDGQPTAAKRRVGLVAESLRRALMRVTRE